MSLSTKSSSLAIGCLLVGVCAGVVGAQVTGGAVRVRYLNSGLVAVDPTETAQFNVTLDDTRAGRSARVLVQFIDRSGAVLAHDDVELHVGQSTSLTMTGPGVFRAHAEIREPNSEVTARRAVVGSLNVLDITTGQRRPECSIDEGGHTGGGRQ